jgi:hypothetical protein
MLGTASVIQKALNKCKFQHGICIGCVGSTRECFVNCEVIEHKVLPQTKAKYVISDKHEGCHSLITFQLSLILHFAVSRSPARHDTSVLCLCVFLPLPAPPCSNLHPCPHHSEPSSKAISLCISQIPWVKCAPLAYISCDPYPHCDSRMDFLWSLLTMVNTDLKILNGKFQE